MNLQEEKKVAILQPIQNKKIILNRNFGSGLLKLFPKLFC